MNEEQEEWIRDFEESTDIWVDRASVEDYDFGWGYGQLHFCARLDKECYTMMGSEEEAEDLAKDKIKQDLEEDPEAYFSDWFLEQQLDTDQMLEEMEADFDEVAYETPESFFWDEGELRDALGLEEREPIDWQEIQNSHLWDKLQESYLWATKKREYAEERVYDKSMRQTYFPNLRDYIDMDSAVEEAISVDGYCHFLNTYDGVCILTNGDRVYWRTD